MRSTYHAAYALAAALAMSQPGHAEPVSVWRLFVGERDDHFYTTSCPESVTAQKQYGYTLEFTSPVFHIEAAETPGTVPLYRFFRNQNHLYSTKKSDGAGYRFEGVLGYIFPNEAPDRVPIYHLVRVSQVFGRTYNGDNFYTTDKDERDRALAQYHYTDNGIIGFTYASGPAANCDPRYYPPPPPPPQVWTGDCRCYVHSAVFSCNFSTRYTGPSAGSVYQQCADKTRGHGYVFPAPHRVQ